MLAPKFVEANTTLLLDRERELLVHKKRLQAIQARKHSADFSHTQKRMGHSNRGFLGSARQVDIMRENKALFEKLLAISQGKGSRFHGETSKCSPKSLNVANRQREVEKITHENQQLAERIVHKSSVLSTKQLLKEYSAKRRCRDRLSKAHLFTDSHHRNKHSIGSLRPDRRNASCSVTSKDKPSDAKTLQTDSGQDTSQACDTTSPL